MEKIYFIYHLFHQSCAALYFIAYRLWLITTFYVMSDTGHPSSWASPRRQIQKVRLHIPTNFWYFFLYKQKKYSIPLSRTVHYSLGCLNFILANNGQLSLSLNSILFFTKTKIYIYIDIVRFHSYYCMWQHDILTELVRLSAWRFSWKLSTVTKGRNLQKAFTKTVECQKCVPQREKLGSYLISANSCQDFHHHTFSNKVLMSQLPLNSS